MTAFLFIPGAIDNRATLARGRAARRVDFGNIASLFAEVEEPELQDGGTRKLLRIGATVLLLLLAIGDTMLVARPAALSGFPTVSQTAKPTL